MTATANSAPEVVYVQADEGIALWVPEEPPPDLVDGEGPEMSTYRFVATADTTGGALAVVDTVVPAGNGPPEHTHLEEDESFFVIDGEFEIEAGGRSFVIREGDYAFVPRGTAHIWKNATSSTARMLRIYTPGGHEQFFIAISRPADLAEPAPRLTSADVARAEARAVEFYGPPPEASGD